MKSRTYARRFMRIISPCPLPSDFGRRHAGPISTSAERPSRRAFTHPESPIFGRVNKPFLNRLYIKVLTKATSPGHGSSFRQQGKPLSSRKRVGKPENAPVPWPTGAVVPIPIYKEAEGAGQGRRAPSAVARNMSSDLQAKIIGPMLAPFSGNPYLWRLKRLKAL